MAVRLAKNALDLGVVTNDGPAALKFYRETLGLPEMGQVPIPNVGVVHRLQCGESFVKVLVLSSPAPARASGGGLGGATGIRYFTLSVTNLSEMTERCRAAGYKIAVEPRELRPGVTVALVEDGEGATVEFMQGA